MFGDRSLLLIKDEDKNSFGSAAGKGVHKAFFFRLSIVGCCFLERIWCWIKIKKKSKSK